MCLQLFSHRCWQYRPHLEVLFPGGELCMALEDYLRMFLLSVRDAPRITMMSISSVAYCRMRGARAYPFLIVHLDDPEISDFSVRMKLQGFDSPMTIGPNTVKSRYDEGGKMSTLSVAHVWESVRRLVGTKRYDVLHTITFRWDVTEAGLIEPSIVDLLALADLSMKWDSSREGYPTALFLALNTLFNADTTSYSKTAPPPGDVDAAAEMKSAILDAFPARRKRLQIDIDRERGARRYYVGFANSGYCIISTKGSRGVTRNLHSSLALVFTGRSSLSPPSNCSFTKKPTYAAKRLKPAFRFCSGPDRIGFGSGPKRGNTINMYNIIQDERIRFRTEQLQHYTHVLQENFSFVVLFLFRWLRLMPSTLISRSGSAEASEDDEDKDGAPPVLGRGQRKKIPNDIIEINELRALNAGLVAQVAHLQGTVERLMAPVCNPRGIDPSDAMVVE
ncbi:hypothetical protein C8R45DRAFT_926765 [Mycena sanguinolenta]|nr:hypothetical protein C8R45DRAFT_926765 [Mycena sanguinolenta]